MVTITKILISKLLIKHKFMVFNLVLCDDYPSAVTILWLLTSKICYAYLSFITSSTNKIEHAAAKFVQH